MDDDQAMAPESPTEPALDGKPARWRQLWQVPVVAASVGLIALGFWQARRDAPTNDFDGALDQVEQLLADGELAQVESRLREGIEPRLAAANDAQRARFHGVAGDWLYERTRSAPTPTAEGWTAALAQYDAAEQGGLPMTVDRRTRQALAAVAVGDLDQATALFEAIATAEAEGDLESERNEARATVQRRIIDRLMADRTADPARLEPLLDAYLTLPGLRGNDEAWAAARLADLRLRADRGHDAVNRLLVDMRRIEPDLGPEDRPAVGELYTLLGEAYFQIGEDDAARRHFEHALEILDDTTPVRGRAESGLALIAIGAGEHEDAAGRFETVARDYAGHPLESVGLLGEAESTGALGEHETSRARYVALRSLLNEDRTHHSVTVERVTDSLVERHDAVLALRLYDEAVAYARLAETLHEAADVPAAVLLRLASSSRVLAEDTVRRAMESAPTPTDADPAELQRAAALFVDAGREYLRHADAVAAALDPAADEAWTDSIWMAADSFDRGGLHGPAAEQFERYLDGHSAEDARAAEARFRLGETLLALRRHDAAAVAFESTISQYPRSPFAARSYVPLARCYVETDRPHDAESVLRTVIEGRAGLEPEAIEFREAMIACGVLLHEQDEFIEAVEVLDEAVRRYPDDARGHEIRFRLGDAYRRIAAGQRERLERPDLTPAERQTEAERREQNLARAMALFEQVVNGYEDADVRRLDPLERDCRRLAHLYRADAAFELGRYEEAIALYDQSERRFSAHPDSMVALIQIVNCWHALGDRDQARTAHRRAELRLAQLPPDAFERSASILSRESWERWLANSPFGAELTASAGEEAGS